MSIGDSTPQLTFTNELAYEVDVYDSFAEQNKEENYFATLTKLGTVARNGGTSQITPIHSPVSSFIVFNPANKQPIARIIWMSFAVDLFDLVAGAVQLGRGDVLVRVDDLVGKASKCP